MTAKQRKILYRIIITLIITIVINFIPAKPEIRFVLFLGAYLVIGYDVLLKAFRGITNGQILDENFLMTIATIGAFALAVFERSGDYNEAVAVMFFYQIGELFQSYAVGKSRRNIAGLMNIRPDYANLEIDGVVTRVSPEFVEAGSVIVVNPGEIISIDGVVAFGESALDTSSVTGETVPRHVEAGDNVISGCININGLLKICTTKEFGESTVSKILELVENASSSKSKPEKFISGFARVYTPIVCTLALLLVVVPWFFGLVFGIKISLTTWIYRALTFLVISCPCALVISIPLTFFGAIGSAGYHGILIKGSNYIETLSKIKTVVFDKTGTLTRGVFEVTSVKAFGISKEELLEFAVLAECSSSHPISRSILKACDKQPDRRRVGMVEEVGGHGVVAIVDDKEITVGNFRLMRKQNIDCVEVASDGTVVYVGINGIYAGYIVVSDVIKESSAKAVSDLKNVEGIKTVMLTGDSATCAERVASALEIDDVHSQLLPSDKVCIIEQLILSKEQGTTVAFVGDGINDAPVLARSDVGIAMGGVGSDAAIEAADVVLMDDDPLKIGVAIKIARKCIRIVRQNIVLSLGIKIICLLFAALGIANMWLGIFADVGVMVLAVLNAIRIFGKRYL